MYNFDNLLKNKELLEEFIASVSADYEDELELISYGYHFTKETLEKSCVKIKYPYDDIEKIMKGLKISFPDCVTKEDIVYTVNYLYQKYYPLIPEISTAIKFSEKYIKDSEWPNYDKPYKLFYDKYWKNL